jgi:hypothetical protein
MSATPAETGDAVAAAVAGYGTAAAIAMLFNTGLAWAKDAWAPLADFMTGLTGNPWITHGLADVVLFVVLGAALTSARHGRDGDGLQLAALLVGTAAAAGGGLALWFVFF